LPRVGLLLVFSARVWAWHLQPLRVSASSCLPSLLPSAPLASIWPHALTPFIGRSRGHASSRAARKILLHLFDSAPASCPVVTRLTFRHTADRAPDTPLFVREIVEYLQNQHSKHHDRIGRLPAGATLPHLLRCQHHSLDVGAKRLPWQQSIDCFERIALRRQRRLPLVHQRTPTPHPRLRESCYHAGDSHSQRQGLFFEVPTRGSRKFHPVGNTVSADTCICLAGYMHFGRWGAMFPPRLVSGLYESARRFLRNPYTIS
jgi:hypothetical protein